jgi:NAD(P)H-dependent FMN reductase
MPHIAIITGSVRPGRFNIQPATWLYEQMQKRTDSTWSLIDVATLNLPFMDEAAPPMQHAYTHPHTIDWSATVSGIDGFIFVTPEYNHSISPVLKNAVDYLYSEWNYKPVGFVSYGSLAGGSRAVEHWRGIAGELKMYDIREQIMFPNYWENIDASGAYQFSERHVASAQGLADSVIFWAEHMKPARELLQKSVTQK